jgi:hypothetical protein
MKSLSINIKLKEEKIEPENNVDSMEYTQRNI